MEGYQLTPPDDVRLVEGSYYHKRGIGIRGGADTDSDGDQMPDDWEKRHGLNHSSDIGEDGALSDRDGDSFSNYEEYQCNSDPNNPPKETIFFNRSGTAMEVVLLPNKGRSWKLEESNNLLNWNKDEEWNSAPEVRSYPNTETSKFFRFYYDFEDEIDLSL